MMVPIVTLVLAALAAITSAAPAHKSYVLLYHEPNFVDLFEILDKDGCSPINFKPGEIKSAIQQPGLVCTYWLTPNCLPDGHTFPWYYTTNDEPYKWDDMSPVRDSVRSIECRPVRGLEDNSLDSRSPQTPGFVSVYNEPNFASNALEVDAVQKCSRNFPPGVIKSLKQHQGAACDYYLTHDCVNSNHLPIVRYDSKIGTLAAPDLGNWSGKIQSFKCNTNANAGEVDKGNTSDNVQATKE